MDIKQIIKVAVRESFEKSAPASRSINSTIKKIITTNLNSGINTTKNLIKEALVALPQSFLLNTEKLSETTKKIHEQLYKSKIDAFNKVSAGLDGANKYESNNNNSNYRSLKMDEACNLNSIKLHELYFYNIADPNSEISVDALPYMKLSRDFGTFENWQFDFMASCKASRSGWAILVYEPYKNVYINVTVDGDTNGLPVGSIPVLVMDMFEHAYMHDYENNVNDYVVAMMREINWNVVEARMALAEKSELSAIYMIKPIYNTAPKDMLDLATNAPIEQVKNSNGESVSSTTSPQAEETPSL